MTVLKEIKIVTIFLVVQSLISNSGLNLAAQESQIERDQTRTERLRSELIGAVAPELTNVYQVNGTDEAPVGLKMYKGKLVVINFWATWCGACVREIPEYNELVSNFKDKPVVFLAISNENQQVLTRFLETRKFNSLVFADPTGATSDLYGVESRPDFVVIDQSGKIARIANADQITNASLTRAIEGDFTLIENTTLDQRLPTGTAGMPNPNWYVESRATVELERTRYETVLELSNAEGMMPAFEIPESGVYSGDGWSVEDFVITAWDTSIFEMEYQYDDQQRRYRFGIKVPPKHWSQSRIQSELRSMLQSAFPDLEISKRKELRKAILLRRISSTEATHLRPTEVQKTGHDFEFGESVSKLELGNASVKKLTTILGICAGSVDVNASKLPVLNETGLSGNVDVLPIAWKTGDSKSFREALAKCGLEYEVVERQIEILWARRKK